MPAPHPSKSRRRAIDLVPQPRASVAKVAKDLGISESVCAAAQDYVAAGTKKVLPCLRISISIPGAGCPGAPGQRLTLGRGQALLPAGRKCSQRNGVPAGPGVRRGRLRCRVGLPVPTASRSG